MTDREIVYSVLENKCFGRTARQLWHLPWATINYKSELDAILKEYPSDIFNVETVYHTPTISKGNATAIGKYTDEWGCVFDNVHEGIIGEVKTALINDDDWEDAENVHIPKEVLTFDIAEVNENIEKNYKNKFTLSGYVPRPFEQLQFIRGTENLYCDLMVKPQKMMNFIDKMHEFYCEVLTKWSKTNVDALMIMDDWGSQNSLLINPELWDEIFRPMYQDYINIAHKAGKKIFMHSDGNTIDIIPRLIEMGLDAFNCQIFCIGVEKLAKYKGKITFWGEIDRQWLLPYGTVTDNENAAQKVYDTLWTNGSCIAQCEFGPGAKPQNIEAVLRKWNELTMKL